VTGGKVCRLDLFEGRPHTSTNIFCIRAAVNKGAARGGVDGAGNIALKHDAGALFFDEWIGDGDG